MLKKAVWLLEHVMKHLLVLQKLVRNVGASSGHVQQVMNHLSELERIE